MKTLVRFFVVIIVSCSFSEMLVAQHKDMMGGSWNNPTSASIANIINDRIYERMRAKARARRKGGAAVASESRVEGPVRKSAAQIVAATRFRSSGTHLTTRELANASGNTSAEKQQMCTLMEAVLTAYQEEERRLGRQNDFALALAVALAVNSSVYNGTPEPEEARLLQMGDVIGELMAEENVFGDIPDRQKQEMYETMVVFTMLVQVGANEAKQNRDAAGVEAYRRPAGKVLTAISGMPPEKIRLDGESTNASPVGPTERDQSPTATVTSGPAMHAASLVKEFESNEVRANQLYRGNGYAFMAR